MKRYRFVGGPLHNRILGTDGRHEVGVSGSTDPRHFSRYLLCWFTTEFGTRYMQYVHESLMRGGHAVPETYQEALPAMRFP
jgi:hypothetical protein